MATTSKSPPAVDDDAPAPRATDDGGGGVPPWMRILPWVSTPILVALVFVGWHFTVASGAISEFVLPPPLTVIERLIEMLGEQNTWYQTRITLTETVVGFLIALVVGVALGVLLGKVVWLERALRPLLVTLQVVPKVALVPLFVILFGFGITSKIIIAGLLAFFPIMLNVQLGIRSVDPGQRDVMRSLDASRWQTFQRLEFQSTLPYIFTGMEVGIVFATIGAIVGEYLGGSQGLGYLVVTSLNALDGPGLFAVIILLSGLGLILYFIVAGMKRFVIPWHESVYLERASA